MRVKAGVTGAAISFRNLVQISSGHGDPKIKAKLLNSQFSSVFSTDNTSNIPDLGTSQYNEAPQITVTQNGVYKSPCTFPFSFRGAIPEFSHFLFLMKVKSFLFPFVVPLCISKIAIF
jgi:hypothetical protein